MKKIFRGGLVSNSSIDLDSILRDRSFVASEDPTLLTILSEHNKEHGIMNPYKPNKQTMIVESINRIKQINGNMRSRDEKIIDLATDNVSDSMDLDKIADDILVALGMGEPQPQPIPDTRYEDACGYWESQWDNVKYCIENNKMMYLMANVQQGKTTMYLTLIAMMLFGFKRKDGTTESNLVDVVWLNTSCLKTLMHQNYSRLSAEFLEQIMSRIASKKRGGMKNCIHLTEEHKMAAVDELSHPQIFVSLEHASRWARLATLINNSDASEDWKILVLLDEADESNPLTSIYSKNSKSEEQFFEILTKAKNSPYHMLQNNALNVSSSKVNVTNTNYTVHVCNVSATLVSVLGVYMQLRNQMGDLETEQMFTPPIPSGYIGFVKPDNTFNNDFFNTDLLVRESYSVDKYYSEDEYCDWTKAERAAMLNTKVDNPRNIVHEELRKYNEETDVTGKHPERVSVINIANEIEHHNVIARIMTSELTSIGENVCMLSDGSSTDDVNGEANHFIITVNNENEEIANSPDKVFGHIIEAKENAVNKTIKCIYFVLKKKGGRGITFAAPDAKLKDNRYKYLYCDAVYTMAGVGSSLESMIQSNRNCATRPAAKTHTTYVLCEEKNGVIIDMAKEIREYHTLAVGIINDLRRNGSLSEESLYAVDIYSNITKDRVNDVMPMTKASKRESLVKEYGSLSNSSERDALVSAGTFTYAGVTFPVYQRDFWVKLDPVIHADILSTNPDIAKDAAKSLVEGKGWANIGTRYQRVLSCNFETEKGIQHMPWKVETHQRNEAGTARHYMSNRGETMGHIITIHEASNGDYYLYYNRPANIEMANVVSIIETEMTSVSANGGKRNLPFDRADMVSIIELNPRKINSVGGVFGPAIVQ